MMIIEGARFKNSAKGEYINKIDLLLKLAELPQEASKREILSVIYDMPVKIWEK